MPDHGLLRKIEDDFSATIPVEVTSSSVPKNISFRSVTILSPPKYMRVWLIAALAFNLARSTHISI
jgi:hypothetical protein